LAGPDGETQEANRRLLPREALGVGEFADAHWSADKATFLAAFATFNREVLARQQKAGLFAHWLNQAVRALGEDDGLPLSQKRERMAWLLATPAQARALGRETLQSLAPWLPESDWRPITEPRRCSDEYPLPLGAIDPAPPALRHRIDVELARDCNGVVK